MMRYELNHRIRHDGLSPTPATERLMRAAGFASAEIHSDRELLVYKEDPALAGSTRIRSVLVPLDGSLFAEHALPLAAGIARSAGAELRVVHVHVPPRPDDPVIRRFSSDRPYGPSKSSRFAYLEDVTRRLARVKRVASTPHLYDGRDVAAALRSAAADVDLVVMATHGRGPLGRFRHGSIAYDLRRHLRPPALFVRGRETPPILGAEPAVRHVLVPLDGTASAEHVLGPAVALGALLGADYTLLRVLPLRYSDGPELAAYHADGLPRSVDPRQPWSTYDELARCAKRLRSLGLKVETQVVFDDRPAARAIVDFARRHRTDLIALTPRRRSVLTRLLLGSTADRVIRASAVPVLVSSPDGRSGNRR